ncbi:unnamed protein product [Amaranthus hypochondriacus]
MKDSSLYLSKCLMSPTCCIPSHEEYARLPPPRPPSNGGRGGGNNRSRRLWRKLLWRLMRESNNCINNNNKVRSPTLTFKYDAISYSQNFDEGFHTQDYPYHQRFSPVIIR